MFSSSSQTTPHQTAKKHNKPPLVRVTTPPNLRNFQPPTNTDNGEEPLARVSTPPLLKNAKRLVREDEGITMEIALQQASGNVTIHNRRAKEKQEEYFFQTGVYFRDLLDAAEYPPPYLEVPTPNGIKYKKDRSKCILVGNQITVNGHTIALFRYHGKAHALLDACKHMGGPLSTGDIEDLSGTCENKGLTLTCPWHGYQFDLVSGECYNNKEFNQPVFTTRITSTGEVEIAFKNFDPSFFDSHHFDKDDPMQ